MEIFEGHPSSLSVPLPLRDTSAKLKCHFLSARLRSLAHFVWTQTFEFQKKDGRYAFGVETNHLLTHLGYCYALGYRVQPGFFVQLAAEKLLGLDVSDGMFDRAMDAEFNSEQDDAIVTQAGTEWCWWKHPSGPQPPYFSQHWYSSLQYLFYLKKLKEDGYKIDDILKLEELKAQTTPWGHHYFAPGLNGKSSAKDIKCDTNTDDPMNVNKEIASSCNPSIFNNRPDGLDCAPLFSWSDAPKMPKDILYRKLGDIQHRIRNAILVVQPALTKFDEAVQQSSFMKQVYEKLLSLHRNGGDRLPWTPETTVQVERVQESYEGDGIADRTEKAGDAVQNRESESHGSGTSLPSSVMSDSGEDSDHDDNGLAFGHMDSG